MESVLGANDDDALARDVEHAVLADLIEAVLVRRKTIDPKRSRLARAHRSRRPNTPPAEERPQALNFPKVSSLDLPKSQTNRWLQADSVKRARTLFDSLAPGSGLTSAVRLGIFADPLVNAMETFVKPNVGTGAKTLPASWYISPEVFARKNA